MYRNHVHRRGRVVRLSGHKTPRPDGANPLLQAAYVRHRILFTSVTDNTPTHPHTHIHTHAHTHTHWHHRRIRREAELCMQRVSKPIHS